MSTEIDTVLSGIIILLLMIVVWKWYGGKSNKSCNKNHMRLPCGCLSGQCRCGGRRQGARINNSQPRRSMAACPGGRLCVCECPLGACNCDPMCKCHRRAAAVMQSQNRREPMEPSGKLDNSGNEIVDIGSEVLGSATPASNYQEATKNMGLEPDVASSHKKWCTALSHNGMATGASSCSTLEETGRSYGTSNYVGLTARKWCKARILAKPADDSRVTPSSDVLEQCDISMDSLI